MARVPIVRYVHNTLKYPDITIHGFRSTFKQWCIDYDKSENTSEMALGHKIGDSTRNAYARGANKIEPLRILMQEWADYCERTEALPGDVVPFRRRANDGK
jgi:integrase